MTLATCGLSAPTSAGLPAGNPPHLADDGIHDYRQFLTSSHHRAFAIAPGGSWGWSAGSSSTQAAMIEALESCQAHSPHKCVPYALDDKIVFDSGAWATLWGPYLKAAEARRARIGTLPGEKFPDLAFNGPSGRPTSVSALSGKVLLLHFWGSWCGPCRRELPQLEQLEHALAKRRDIVFVLLPVRESVVSARRWANQHDIHLPISDSGNDGSSSLPLADGNKLTDRQVAKVFPTTYVLDKHGVVVFSHAGPVPDWIDYAAFLLDTAARSGR